MTTTYLPATLADYEQAAREFEASLTLEDIMESTRQATQRKYTWQSLDELHRRDPRVEVFNELLVQAERESGGFVQVVPDNMLLVTTHPPRDRKSFNMRFEPVRPFMAFEYVSDDSAQKDYVTNLRKYRELQVPYYAIFDPPTLSLDVHRLGPDGYERLEPDSNGRVFVPELDLQLGVQDGWVRFWHRDQLLPIADELSDSVDELSGKVVVMAEKIEGMVGKIDVLSDSLRQRDEELAAKQSQLNAAVNAFRQLVENLATKQQRPDILAQLATTADIVQLQQWVTELSSRP